MSTIIIVDDNDIDLQMFTNQLESAGYNCISISNPELALEVIQKEQPSFVLLDYEMPHKSGTTLCRDLKLNPLTRDIPVMFLTASDDPENVIATLHLGVIDYIRKPIDKSELIDIIYRHDFIKSIKDAFLPMKRDAERIRDKYERRVNADT